MSTRASEGSVAGNRMDPSPRTARRVVALVAVRDEQGVVHPRGKVVELDPGRTVFYRDITPGQLVTVIDGYALEVGVLAWLEEQGVSRIHYRVQDGPLLAASVDDFREHGAAWDKGGRDQRVLPVRRWTQYAPALAYAVPRVEMPWTVVDHATGLVVTELPHEPQDPDEVNRGAVGGRLRATMAMARLRGVPRDPGVEAVDLLTVVDHLWRLIVEEE